MSKKTADIIWIKNEHSGQIVHNTENLKNVRTLLDSTGKGFCLAKFTQATIHLATGQVHSCHHPATHEIPITELAENPAALFNTKHLKQARQQMLDGARPSECDYCWRVEDNNDGLSDRFYKSLEPWALPHHDTIQQRSADADLFPTYLEVDFSNVCNLACTYCGPEYSSRWAESLKRHGPVKLLENTKYVQWAQGWQKDLDDLVYKNREHNPYVEAFWKWFPEAYKHLRVYRITGGEPLLSKETFKSIDWLLENPNTELEFSINSNLMAPEKVWDSFIEKITKLAHGNYVKKFTVFTSVDGWGKQAEYARPGLDFELFRQRYEQLVKIGNIRAVIMCTFNIFSVTTMHKLLEWQVALKRQYNPDEVFAKWEDEYDLLIDGTNSHKSRLAKSKSHYALVAIDIPYLRHPTFLDVKNIDQKLIEDYLLPAMNYMAANTSSDAWGLHQGFEQYEVEKFKRIVLSTLHSHKHKRDSHDTKLNRAKFYDFIIDMDKRHNNNFVETFPEMRHYFEICRASAFELRTGQN